MRNALVSNEQAWLVMGSMIILATAPVAAALAYTRNVMTRWYWPSLSPWPLRQSSTSNLNVGALSVISIDGKKAVEGQIPRTQRFVFSADEGADVGETNVSPDYKQGDNMFTGHIANVTIEVK